MKCLYNTYCQTDDEEFMKNPVQFSSGSVVWDWSSELKCWTVSLELDAIKVCNSIIPLVLCISTSSKQVLRTLFAGWNHFFQCFNLFSLLFPLVTENEETICFNAETNDWSANDMVKGHHTLAQPWDVKLYKISIFNKICLQSPSPSTPYKINIIVQFSILFRQPFSLLCYRKVVSIGVILTFKVIFTPLE